MVVRVVIDTSVMIAALISEKGASREILRRCLKGAYVPLMSNSLFGEYEDVASRPEILSQCPLKPNEIQDLLHALYAQSTWVPIYFLWRPNLPDEADNHLLELAVTGQAQWLVTHNVRDFGRAELQFKQLEIRTPEDILKGERYGDIDN